MAKLTLGKFPSETPIFLSKKTHFTPKINILRHIVTAKHQKQKNYLTKKFDLHIIIQTIYRGKRGSNPVSVRP